MLRKKADLFRALKGKSFSLPLASGEGCGLITYLLTCVAGFGSVRAGLGYAGDTSETLTEGCPKSGLFEALLRCKSLKEFLLKD